MLTYNKNRVKIVYIGGKKMDASKITFKTDLTYYEILQIRNLIHKQIRELKERAEKAPNELLKKYDEEDIEKLTPLFLKLEKMLCSH